MPKAAENLTQSSLSGTSREIKQTVTNRFDPVRKQC